MASAGTGTDLSIRRGSADDARACHDLLWASVTDFAMRNATPLAGSADEWWLTGESVHRFLAEHAAEWWVAEDPITREVVGYARSIVRGGLVELTEFFVRPGRQSAGIGRTLIERAFPAGRGEVRSIIATGDVRALARYYAAGTVIRFPILNLGRPPRPAAVEGLQASRLHGDANLDEVAEIERTVVGFARGEDELRWLLGTREGYVYRRGASAVGFAFVGHDASGPIAVRDPADLPEMLLHVEDRAAALGVSHLEFEVPAVNATAIRHLLGRGFKLNPWINYLMADRPFGTFDRYVCFSPPIFL